MTELKLLDVSWCELRTIELGAFNGLTKLTGLSMQGNKISDILPGTFENMSSLEYLDLRNNEIKHLNSAMFGGLGAFHGLTNLTQLLMWGNEISEIMPGTFENLSSLEYLDLSYNKIKYLNSAMFSGLGAFNGLTKLTRLSILRNKISDILPGTFENMSSLEHLQLGYNRIVNLDSAVFSGLINLKYVGLSANKLQYLHPHTFLGLPNIKHLHLKKNMFLQVPTDRNFINSSSLSRLYMSLCNISSVSAETFAKVSSLEHLDLGENNLRTVDLNIMRTLPKLSTLYLYGNRLQCDCQLQDVWRWCEDRNIRTGYESVVAKCDTPNEVNRMWWGVLEKGQCLDGNIQYIGDYNNTSYSETDIGAHKYEYGKDYNINQYQLPVYAVPFIFGTIGNVILLIIIICNKDMRTVPNMYILNLAISDIIHLTVFFSEAYANRITVTWLDDEFWCIFVSFCRRMSVGLSAYSAALYSFQRYRVTVRPFKVRVSSQPKWRGIVATFFVVWIVAALLAVPSTISKIMCEEFKDVGFITYYQHVVIFEFLIFCVVPLCVIAFCYITTARHLVESSRSVSEGTRNLKLKARRNSAKIVLGLAVVFVVSYMPYYVFWTYYICSQKYTFSTNIMYKLFKISSNIKTILLYWNDTVRYMYQISTFFLSINSCLNPVALFCTSSPFRHYLKRYLTCFCKTSSPTDFELESRN